MEEMYRCNRNYMFLYLQKELTEVKDFRKGYGVYEAIERMKNGETILLTENDEPVSKMKMMDGEYTEISLED